jgi:aspartate/methionine/tyrosine aminotransferase
VAKALVIADEPYEGCETYYHSLRAKYTEKRKVLVDALTKAGLDPIVPQAGFFIMTGTSAMDPPAKYLAESTPSCPEMTRDWALARYLTIERGVACIPPSAFYCAKTKPLAANLLRFAFCKTDTELAKAAERLAAVEATD